MTEHSPVSGMIWLSKLVRQFDGDVVAVCDYLAAVSTAMAGAMLRQGGGDEEACWKAYERIEGKVNAWVGEQREVWTGAEWVLAAAAILSVVAENGEKVREAGKYVTRQ